LADRNLPGPHLLSLPGFPGSNRPIYYLSEAEVDALTQAFEQWYDSAEKRHVRRSRGRYWIVYLVLRFTGARIGEVLMLDETRDVDFRRGEIRLQTLKSHRGKRRPTRVIPVRLNVTSEIATYIAEFPEMRGKAFGLQQSNFRRRFRDRALKAKIQRENAHPHIMRHTRAMELLRAGVPVTLVQDILGHSALTTTAAYLRISGQEARSILQDKGMI